MIEINLLGNAGRKSGRRKLAAPFKLPKLPGLGGLDRFVLGMVLTWAASLLLVGFMFVSVGARRQSVENDLSRARSDSTKFAAQMRDNERLKAQRDSVAVKLLLIQDLDDGRYIWPHVLDEIGRAVPQFTWLTNVTHIQGDSVPVFSIQGMTGNNFALTEFMKNLEASPFIQGVRLASTEMAQLGDDLVHEFQLEASYEPPSPELIETIPLIAASEEVN